MATFVLVHGAWHWGGCWAPVQSRLEAAGHTVYTPSLAMHPAATLESHVNQVVVLLQEHDLQQVVLVGHSYAGAVVAGVLAREARRVHHTLFLDAFLPQPGESLMGQLLPAFGVAALRMLARLSPTLPIFISARGFGISDAEQVRWVDSHLRPHPASTVLAPFPYTLHLEPAHCTYVVCRHPVNITGRDTLVGQLFERLLPASPLAKFAQIAVARGLIMHELDTGHDAMITAPEQVAKLVLAVAPAELVPAGRERAIGV